jgi:hypothetical protein
MENKTRTTVDPSISYKRGQSAGVVYKLAYGICYPHLKLEKKKRRKNKKNTHYFVDPAKIKCFFVFEFQINTSLTLWILQQWNFDNDHIDFYYFLL